MAEYIELVKRVKYAGDVHTELLKAGWDLETATLFVNNIPDAADVVPKGALDQVIWERDLAMEQLKDHGIPFGGIAPDVIKVVRCENCAVPHNKWTGCPKLGGLVTPPDFHCGFGERIDA